MAEYLLHLLATDVVTVPLPSSMMMGLALLGGVAAFGRFRPKGGRRRRR